MLKNNRPSGALTQSPQYPCQLLRPTILLCRCGLLPDYLPVNRTRRTQFRFPRRTRFLNGYRRGTIVFQVHKETPVLQHSFPERLP